jgi:CUE domain
MLLTFIDLDKEVVEAVIVAKDGRVGVCIDICLEMSSGIQTPNEPHEVEQGIPESHLDRSGKENGKAPEADSVDLLGLEGEEGIGSITIDDEGRGRNRADQVDLMS